MDLSTVAGTAINRQDYYGIYRTLEFAAGETTKNTWLQIVNDDVAEATEQLQARIFNPRGACISIAISDDDVSSTPSKGNSDIAGIWFGHMLACCKGADTGEGGGNRFIGGDAQGRQLFTVTDRNCQVDGVWVRVDRANATTLPLSVQLNSGANTLAGASISAAAVVARCDTGCSGSWVITDLSSTVNLQQGETCTLQFTAAAGSRYSLQSGFQLDYAPFKMADEQTVRDGGVRQRRSLALMAAIAGARGRSTMVVLLKTTVI